MDKDRIITLFWLFCAILCDSKGILNVTIDLVEQKLPTNTIYNLVVRKLNVSEIITDKNADYQSYINTKQIKIEL